MRVRPIAMASDIPALQALWRATWRDTYGPILGAGRLHLIDVALAEPAVLTMFAADGGALAAIVDGAVAGSVCFAERRGVGYVWGMYVHPAHRRRGIGSTLLHGAAEGMPGAEILELSTVTAASAAFYRHLGFADVGCSGLELFPGVTCASTLLSAAAAKLRVSPLPTATPWA